MGEASTLGLQSFHHSARHSSNTEVARGSKIVLRGRLSLPVITRIVFLTAQKHIPHAQQMLMSQRIQKHKEIGLRHGMCGNHLVHVL